MSATRRSGLAAIVLLCSVMAAAAATKAPGSTEPVTSAPAPQPAAKPAEEAKPAARPKARVHRTRHCAYRPFYLVPPPRYWFQPYYRCYSHRSYGSHHRHRYAHGRW